MRPATGEDYWYCYRVMKKNMLELFARHWGGWNPAKFREGFDLGAISIVMVAGSRAGYLSVKPRQDGLYIDNIQLSPRFQGRGLGTNILTRLIADNPSAHIYLTTFSDNPAKRLYERLGFTIADRDGATLTMLRNPQGGTQQPDSTLSPRDRTEARSNTFNL